MRFSRIQVALLVSFAVSLKKSTHFRLLVNNKKKKTGNFSGRWQKDQIAKEFGSKYV
jgi:hypothetical protein